MSEVSSEAPSGLERSLIQVLSNTTDERGEPGWLTFNQLLVKVSGSYFAESDDDDYGKDSAAFIDLAERLLEQAVADGLVDKYENASVGNTRIRLSNQGVNEKAEYDDLVQEDDTNETAKLALQTFDSSNWTGLKLSQEQVDQAIAEITKIERAVEMLDCDNVKRAQALALLGAAKTLLGAPEPPFDIIRMILLNLDRMIGIAGLLVGWISLVQSWNV